LSLIVQYANFVKVKLSHFLLMVVVLQNVLQNALILCSDIMHSGVWGISLVISHAQYKYFMTFIDDFS
jgi:hypothetical protein